MDDLRTTADPTTTTAAVSPWIRTRRGAPGSTRRLAAFVILLLLCRRGRRRYDGANGKFSNADLPTLKTISDAAKRDVDFTIWLTNSTGEFELPDISKGVQAFFDAEKAAGRTYRANQRKSDDLSVVIEL